MISLVGDIHCLILRNGSKQLGIQVEVKTGEESFGFRVDIGDGCFDMGWLVLINAFSVARPIKQLPSCIRLGSVCFRFVVVTLTSSRGITLKGETLHALALSFLF